MKLIKNLNDLLIGILIGGVVIGGGVYATALAASAVTYSNTTSKLSSTNAQGAVDALYVKAKEKALNANISSAYTYNSSSCVTGDESSCNATTCYKKKTSGSCPSGTIINYKVNSTTTKRFHVLYDNGSTITMQTQGTISYGINWSSSSANGPTKALAKIEDATSSWSNVNNQTYTLGTTSFKTNSYTKCPYSVYTDAYGHSSNKFVCSTNSYTMSSRTAKARLISLQEAIYVGCSKNSGTCPKWMYNYLYSSSSYGYGGVDDNTTGNMGYWTLQTGGPYGAWYVAYTGSIEDSYVDFTSYGARAVVVISK